MFYCIKMYYLSSGVFNLSDNAGHINSFNDARGPLFKILIVFTYEPDSYLRS